MMANIIIEKNSLHDHASVIRDFHEAPAATVDFAKIESELLEIKKTLKTGAPDYQAVETLEGSAKRRDWKALVAAIGKFTGQFSNAALANLAGNYLSSLLHL